LLAAALEEFSAKGYAGARVQDIADRAGVNKQLIPYYFGGKEGLYRALEQTWLDQEASFALPETPFDEIVGAYVHATFGDPRLLRLMIWDGLTEDKPGDNPGDKPAAADGPHSDVVDMTRRQAAGEIPADLDPRLFLLTLTAAIAAPVILPQIARRLGVDPAAPGFEDAYADHMRRLIQLLGGPEVSGSGR